MRSQSAITVGGKYTFAENVHGDREGVTADKDKVQDTPTLAELRE